MNETFYCTLINETEKQLTVRWLVKSQISVNFDFSVVTFH